MNTQPVVMFEQLSCFQRHLAKISRSKVVSVCHTRDDVWLWFTATKTYLSTVPSIGIHSTLNRDVIPFDDVLTKHQVIHDHYLCPAE